jgi:PhzF family phenazine biosynthesis protein
VANDGQRSEVRRRVTDRAAAGTHPAYYGRVPVLVQVDAFTDRLFGGNPAAVCLLPEPADAAWMQAVADEMQLAATAFVSPLANGWALRWFSPTSELALCGHGTLASAHVLLEQGDVAPDALMRFTTQAGLLTARRRGEARIELDFPAQPSTPADAPADLLGALRQTPLRVERTRFDYLLELESEAAVREAAPDLVRLRRVAMRGLILTARSSTAAGDFVSRFFAPSVGIDEDSVTGSAHCCLGPYWQRTLSKSELIGIQVSRRGGVVHVQVEGDRVRLSGQAVTVLRGDLLTAARVSTLRTRRPD